MNKHNKFSIRKLTIGTISVAVGLVFVNDVTGMSRVEASLSVEDSNYINQTAPDNGALVEYIRQALETISKAADSTVLPTSIQNLKNKVQSLSTKNESDYTESTWQEFQGKLTTAKSKLEEAEKAYNKAVSIKPNASSYETTINELITSYPEYNTVVIRVREGETTEDAENRHLTNIRRINQVLTAKYEELRETAQLVKAVLPPVGGDIATQQLEIINSAENILELNKKEATVAQERHADLMAGLFEDNKVVLSGTSNLRGTITPEDQTKIKAFLESHNPSMGETSVFITYEDAVQYKFNNDGTVTITYTDDGSSDTVPLSIFAKGGSTQADSPAATYTVTYNYVSGTPDKSLPSSITAPAVVSDKHTGDVVASPTGQTDVEDAGNQGTWHFNGWDKASVTIGTANETVTGTWNFVPTPPAATYSVTYNYVSGTPDKSLPSSITVPAAVNDKHTGDVVASPTGQTDVEDAGNQGTWHFNGWDKASVTIGTANETVTGTWNFVPTPPAATYSVTYNYVSGTPDKTLPSNITAPVTVSDKHTGDVVASPTDQTDVEDAANQGTWHFNGWDKASVTIGTSDETVTGTWNFVPTPPAAIYSVTYNYVSGTPDKTLPSNITAPVTVSDKHTGDVVASPTGQTDVEDAVNQGTWHFNGWDKASVTVGTSDETVTGTWIFTATPGEKPGTTPDTTTPGEKPDTTPGTTIPEENPSTTPGTTIPEENPSTTPGTTTPGENPSTTPGTTTPGEKPGTTPGTATPGEKPDTIPGTTTPGEKPDTTPGTATPGEKPSTTPGTTTPGEKPDTTPGTATPGEKPSTTPGTTTPGEKPSTTPGTTTPGEKPDTTPGTATPGEKPSTTPGTATPGEKPSTTPGTTTPGEKPGTTPDTTSPGEKPSTTPDTVTPRTTYLYVTSKEDKMLPNSVVEGWSKKDGHWLYQLEDGSHIVNEWKQINGTWYRFDNSGLMQTGWIKENGTWYYLNDSGAMQTGWAKENGTWYYLNDSGAMQTGWVKENGTWYYLNQSGSMEIGWFTVSDKWYYANESGALAINTTTPDGYTVNADGEWVE